MESDKPSGAAQTQPKQFLAALCFSVLPALCYLGGRLLLKWALPLLLPGLSSALQALLCTGLLLPLSVLFFLRSPKRSSVVADAHIGHTSDAAQSETDGRCVRPLRDQLWKPLCTAVLGLLCLILLILSALRCRDTATRLDLLTACLLAPAAEELIYRGAVLRRAERFLPLLPAFLLSTLLFAVGHGSLMQLLIAIPVGLLLCLADRGLGVTAPILLHILWNLLM